MATLERPGVNVKQVITAASPTVLTPTLVPCIIGPCYQIVEPLVSGALNPSALITTAAVLEADAAYAAPIAMSELLLKVTVNGTLESVQFPVVKGVGGFSQALIVNILNAGLSGAYAEYGADNILRIFTYAKGTNASIAIQAVGDDALNTAATPLDFTTTQTVAGKSQYDNLGYEIPYSSLPSPMTAVDNVVFDEDELSMYRYFGNTLVELSQTSAIDWTGYVPKEAYTAAITMHNATSQWRPVPLYALQTSGSKTNKLQNWGTQASVIFPLNQDTDVGSGVAVQWPDASGGNYLRVTCQRTDSVTGAKGLLSGAAGNALTVKRLANGGAGPAAGAVFAWDGINALTFQPTDANTTFAGLKTALDLIKITYAVRKDIEIELVYNSGSDALKCATGIADNKTYTAFGGSDPDNFGVAAITQAADSQYASLTGATKVGAGTTASTLGIGGMILSISVNGSAWLDITLTGGAAVLTTINNATTAHTPFSANIAAIKNITLPEATTADVLQLNTKLITVASSGLTGADNTLEVKASDPLVLEQLFGGYSARTDAIPANGMTDVNAWGGAGVEQRRPIIEGGTDINKQSVAAFDRSIVPGSITIQMTNLTVNGFIACTPVAGELAAGAKVLRITHTTAAPVTTTVDLDLQNGALATALSVAEQIAARLLVDGAAALALLVQVSLVNGQIVIAEMTGEPGATVKLVSGAGSTANVITYLRGGGGIDPFDTAVTTIATGSAVLKDDVAGAWQVTSVGATTLDNCLSNPAFTESAAELTALMLDPQCSFNYSTGSSEIAATEVGAILFSGQLSVGVPIAVHLQTCLTIALNTTTTANFTHTRTRSNLLSAVAPSAQTSPLQYGGRIFQARSNAVAIGDTVYSAGVVKGRVMGFESANGWTNNVLVLSDFTVDNGSSLSQWYVRAENLTSVSARILPELVVDVAGETVTAKHALNRNIAGIPTPSRSLAPAYIGYKALRTDVSAAATNPALLAFANLDEVETVIGPVDPENPLAFALRTAFLHTTDIVVTALGISETTADAPDGTVDAYIEALDFLELKEVYALAPLSQAKAVHDIFSAHVTAMSAETGRKERVAFVNLALPTEEAPASAVTGLMKIGAAYGPANSKYDLTFQGSNPPDAKTAIGANSNANGDSLLGLETFTAADGVYLERAGDSYKYLVVGVSSDGTVVTIETADIYGPGSGPGSGGNSDAYFRTSAPLLFEADGEQCGVWVRQAAIDTTTTAGKLTVCETLAELAGGPTGYQNKRLFFSQPEQLGLDHDGSEVLVPGFHACVADCARSGQQSPSQPFTNLPYVGFTRVIGSSDRFSENQMATAAAGGVWWVIQDVAGGSLVCRHQLSTDTSTLKLREYSITRSIDYVAKVVRAQTRRFIGRNNITKSLLDMLGLSLNAALSSVIGSVVQGATVDSIAQSSANPDQVEVTVTVSVFYPCNKITITIVA